MAFYPGLGSPIATPKFPGVQHVELALVVCMIKKLPKTQIPRSQWWRKVTFTRADFLSSNLDQLSSVEFPAPSIFMLAGGSFLILWRPSSSQAAAIPPKAPFVDTTGRCKALCSIRARERSSTHLISVDHLYGYRLSELRHWFLTTEYMR